jgi:hypothetical protein
MFYISTSMHNQKKKSMNENTIMYLVFHWLNATDPDPVGTGDLLRIRIFNFHLRYHSFDCDMFTAFSVQM